VLVSAIAQYDAINSRNNALMSMMQTSNEMINTVGNLHSFSGEQNLGFWHRLDNQFALDMITDSLRYKIALLQEKMFKKIHSSEIENSKNSLNYLA